MPRLDRTYTAADLIRYWVNNLDRREQTQFKAFFGFLFQERFNRDRRIIGIAGTALSLVPIAGTGLALGLAAGDLAGRIARLEAFQRGSRAAIREAGLSREAVLRLFAGL